MFVVDRDSFISWVQGIMLDRDSSGNMIIGDDIRNEEAHERLLKGEDIYLSDCGEIVSKIRNTGEEFLEEKIEVSYKGEK